MKRSPGRPPIAGVDDVPARLHVTLPSEQYDKAYARAQREGVSVPELARRGLARVLADNQDDE
jgi:hypothetical protein